MPLSPLELKLCTAYERQGRGDLAQCIKSARVYQLLDGFLETDLYSPGRALSVLPYLHAMRSILDPSWTPEPFKPVPIWFWIKSMAKQREGEEGVALVQRLDYRNRKGRVPSKIVYPLKRTLCWAWKGFRNIIP